MAASALAPMATPFAGAVTSTEKRGRGAARLKTVSVFRLRWHELQPRDRHSDANVNELMESIQELGLLEPPLVWRTKRGKLVILCGHRRVRAWQLLVQSGFFDNDRIRVFLLHDLSEGQAAVIMAAEYGHRREYSAVHTATLIGEARKHLLTEASDKITVRTLAAVLPWKKSSIDDYLAIYGALQDPELRDFVHSMDKAGKNLIRDIVTAKAPATRVQACEAFRRGGVKAARESLAVANGQSRKESVRVTGRTTDCTLTYDLRVSLRPDLSEEEIAAIEAALGQVEEDLARIRAGSEEPL
jgi:ParB/RepB/Spo0J family partition protein